MRRHRVFVAEHGQRLEGFHLFGLRHVGLEHGDQFGRFDRRRGRIVGSLDRDGDRQRSGQQESVSNLSSRHNMVSFGRFVQQTAVGEAVRGLLCDNHMIQDGQAQGPGRSQQVAGQQAIRLGRLTPVRAGYEDTSSRQPSAAGIRRC